MLKNWIPKNSAESTERLCDYMYKMCIHKYVTQPYLYCLAEGIQILICVCVYVCIYIQ